MRFNNNTQTAQHDTFGHYITFIYFMLLIFFNIYTLLP